MLENLTERLARVVKSIRGEARLTEANTQEMLREVRLALLDADVALHVVKDFIAKVKDKAMGQEVQSSLTPGQAMVGIVHKELVGLMSGSQAPIPGQMTLNLATSPPAVVLMAGLQGAGKTTTVGKLAKWLHDTQKKRVLTVSCDVYRPAAIDQLRLVSEQAGVDFFPTPTDAKPVAIARQAMDHARRHLHDVVLVDTAGRLAIDEDMMREIAELHAAINPIETLFTVDAMQGQDAVRTAAAFKDTIPLTGVMLTKIDGDSRGGAVLSVRAVTGCPIKFVGTSEKIDGLEAFDPERMANRILGMGDILAIVEQAQKTVDLKSAEKMAEKFKSGGRFDLNDFKMQIGQMRNMGGLSSLVDKLPAQMQQAAKSADLSAAEKSIPRMEGIINSMTPRERAHPELLKASRKRRVAAGAGVTVQEVNRMLNQFEQMQDMMKKMQKGGLAKMMRAVGAMKGMGGLPGIGGFGKR
ncbi:MAG: signal recognition particle protein [Burkholderiaceae bacterium]|nr:signal recognition particle protein [Burkholderiaceae bacterium]